MARLFARVAAELKVVDLGKELVIESIRKPSLAEGVLSAVATGGFVAILASRFWGIAALLVAAFLAALLVFLLAMRATKVELRVTRLEFTSRGPVAGDFGSIRNAYSADIQWLEYQEAEPGGDSGKPGGLYAVLGRRSVCLLPDVDAWQTNQLIDRIEAKFPDLYEQRLHADPFGQRLTLLRLNDPR
jgi:hypothetical protein